MKQYRILCDFIVSYIILYYFMIIIKCIFIMSKLSEMSDKICNMLFPIFHYHDKFSFISRKNPAEYIKNQCS